MIRTRLLAAALVLVVCWPVHAVRLRIVYTNDLHARLDRLPSIEKEIDRVRAAGDPVLLVDAGDAWQDFRVPVYSVWASEPMEQWMSRVGYSAMVLGNHDLALGWAAVQVLVQAASFPVLCANVEAVDGTVPPFPGSFELAIGGLDVLVVGITTDETFPALGIPWLRPTPPAAALRKEIERAKRHPDLIVCLAHLPVQEAEALAVAVPQVAVFVTGHSHEQTPIPVAVGNSLVVQSGAFGEYVGELRLDVQEGKAQLLDNTLVPTEREAGTDLGPGLARLAEVLGLALAFALFLNL